MFGIIAEHIETIFGNRNLFSLMLNCIAFCISDSFYHIDVIFFEINVVAFHIFLVVSGAEDERIVT